ncbi:hypothetical protein VOLCADRAFT_85869 [Volvox carteri f. nagariensis]|uniref:Protein kinase domain-containing protein n=1 Tax=Volvox carteri f. nagariensis TaxID=3068 RepID=D8TH77_VOLCA|nr:uncharacterized protein VOLCADRAFT_85869 [Volvox carteri f. nagariensis]EFJ52663.1 hypothetical protein VOLCADRAFT_85869 [Volvox carteri f. nagariensis]|eukprot:XP_002945668.1 hypothetical protein VOLCADRAFT_85869 [Volvox carteri f. nagariensis]
MHSASGDDFRCLASNGLDLSSLRVSQQLGRGGFATCWRATYNGQNVALKVMLPRPTLAARVAAPADGRGAPEDDLYERMFLREAQVTSQLEHRHIVQCFGVAQLPAGFVPKQPEPSLAMVLELCEQQLRLTASFVDLGQSYHQIASALAHLHRQKSPIIHRDVKPENVLFKRDPSTGELICKLSDLGLHAEVSEDRSVMLRKSLRSTSSLADISGHEKDPSLRMCVSRFIDGSVRGARDASGRSGTLGVVPCAEGSPFLTVSVAPSFSTAGSRNIGGCRIQRGRNCWVSGGAQGIKDAFGWGVLATETGSRGLTPISKPLDVIRQECDPNYEPRTAAIVVDGMGVDTSPPDQGFATGRELGVAQQQHQQQQEQQLVLQNRQQRLQQPMDEKESSLKLQEQQLQELQQLQRHQRSSTINPCGDAEKPPTVGASVVGETSVLQAASGPATPAAAAATAAAAAGAALHEAALAQRSFSTYSHHPPHNDDSETQSTLASPCSLGPMSPLAAVSATLSVLLSCNPDLVEPVSAANLAVGLRNVGSLLRQLGKSELKPLRRHEMEWVYGLTGKAGSLMYMAPEVFQHQPYNEKSDVFSFGVLAYELLASEMLLISIFNTGRAAKMGIRDSHGYAAKVAEGFRPPRIHALPDAAWSIIERCWHRDPVQRPTMAQVQAEFQKLLAKEIEGFGGGGGGGAIKRTAGHIASRLASTGGHGAGRHGGGGGSCGGGGAAAGTAAAAGTSGASKGGRKAPRVTVGSANTTGGSSRRLFKKYRASAAGATQLKIANRRPKAEGCARLLAHH